MSLVKHLEANLGEISEGWMRQQSGNSSIIGAGSNLTINAGSLTNVGSRIEVTMGAFDYFGEASAIAQALDASGRPSDAEKIRSAMEDGSTGTEIFMMLKFQLETIMTSAFLPGDTRARAITLHSRLAAALSQQ